MHMNQQCLQHHPMLVNIQTYTTENNISVIVTYTMYEVLVAIHYSVLDARNGYIRNVVV